MQVCKAGMMQINLSRRKF